MTRLPTVCGGGLVLESSWKEAADIVVKHVKGLDPEVAFQEIAIVNALVATPEARQWARHD
jgi:hypothetical protein